MTAKYLVLIRGKGYHLDAGDIYDNLKKSGQLGLILVYSQMFDNNSLRDMQPMELRALPLQEGILELRTPNDHPNQKRGYIFLFNAEPADARKLLNRVGWSYEAGDVAYSPRSGKPLPPSFKPYFARLEDIFNFRH